MARRTEPPKHYIDRKKFRGGEILCGTALPTVQSAWRTRATEDVSEVTCRKCMKLIAVSKQKPTDWS